MKFFSFWRSQASFRVRIALNLKKLPTEVVFVDLDADAHHADAFRRVNPQMALPALVEDDGTTLFQSLAIIEYLEETHPTPPLLPADPRGRARVRGLALIVACEGHPPVVPRIRRYLDRELNLQIPSRRRGGALTVRRWPPRGHLAGQDTGRFCHGARRRWPTSASPATPPWRRCCRSISPWLIVKASTKPRMAPEFANSPSGAAGHAGGDAAEGVNALSASLRA
jgi:maleylacetoacetate isomerase/maleylpyruvate isomerase